MTKQCSHKNRLQYLFSQKLILQLINPINPLLPILHHLIHNLLNMPRNHTREEIHLLLVHLARIREFLAWRAGSPFAKESVKAVGTTLKWLWRMLPIPRNPRLVATQRLTDFLDFVLAVAFAKNDVFGDVGEVVGADCVAVGACQNSSVRRG